MSELSPEQISKLTTKVIEEAYSLTRSECLLVLEALADTQKSPAEMVAELARVQQTANELRVERDTATTRAERAEADLAQSRNLVKEVTATGLQLEHDVVPRLQAQLTTAREEAKRMREWRTMLESAPGESAGIIRDRVLSSAYLEPILGAWKHRCASLEARWGTLREAVAELNGKNLAGPLYSIGFWAARDRVLSLIDSIGGKEEPKVEKK